MHGALPAGCTAVARCAGHAASPGLPTGIAAVLAAVVLLLAAVVAGYEVAAVRADRERHNAEGC
jgi:hypothetical protein